MRPKRNKAVEEELKNLRPSKEQKVQPLIQPKEDWKKVWWGMPSFEQEDKSPEYKVVISFLTKEDMLEFQRRTGIEIPSGNSRTRSMWFPDQYTLSALEYTYEGPQTDSLYPVCIPSKGRAENQTTGKVLEELGVSHKFFVEEHEAEEYASYVGEERVVAMPFRDLGRGSVPARNFIWKWCREREYERHWTMDDNIACFGRYNLNRRITCKGGGFFRAMEDFVDRYENVSMAGPHHIGFIDDRRKLAPVLFNHRVYSCILLDTSLYPEFKWRGKYNEDTDLSLRLLKSDRCTLLFQALYMAKKSTSSGGGSPSGMKGGNTDNVYNTGDHRLAFAKSLQKQHPDVVKVVWKWGRWHHLVDYSPFKQNKPILKPGIVPVATDQNYEMELRKRED